MQSLLLDEPRERRSDFKLSGTARKQVTQAESVIYGRMIATFQVGTRDQMKNHSPRVSQVLENTTGYAIGNFRD
jgi:hypothetical protein